MGQLITVTEKPTRRPGVVAFELNRSLTGMGHERFRSAADVVGNRPSDELARRLLERDTVRSIHIYSNVVTVELADGASSEGLADVIRDLFIYYGEGVPVVDPMATGEPGEPDGEAQPAKGAEAQPA